MCSSDPLVTICRASPSMNRSTTLACPLSLLVPPLGHHTPEELATDVEAIPAPPQIEANIRRSSRRTKGEATT